MLEAGSEICSGGTSSNLTLDGFSEGGPNPTQNHLILSVPRVKGRVGDDLASGCAESAVWWSIFEKMSEVESMDDRLNLGFPYKIISII